MWNTRNLREYDILWSIGEVEEPITLCIVSKVTVTLRIVVLRRSLKLEGPTHKVTLFVRKSVNPNKNSCDRNLRFSGTEFPIEMVNKLINSNPFDTLRRFRIKGIKFLTTLKYKRSILKTLSNSFNLFHIFHEASMSY